MPHVRAPQAAHKQRTDQNAYQRPSVPESDSGNGAESCSSRSIPGIAGQVERSLVPDLPGSAKIAVRHSKVTSRGVARQAVLGDQSFHACQTRSAVEFLVAAVMK